MDIDLSPLQNSEAAYEILKTLYPTRETKDEKTFFQTFGETCLTFNGATLFGTPRSIAIPNGAKNDPLIIRYQLAFFADDTGISKEETMLGAVHHLPTGKAGFLSYNLVNQPEWFTSEVEAILNGNGDYIPY